jgi:hypothetical protein
LSEAELVSFEQRNGLGLPVEYREFLLVFGNGGAGPNYGIMPLTEAEREVSARAGDEDRLSLSDAFNAPKSIEESRAIGYPTHGILPLAEIGCGGVTLLAVSGPECGNIWCFANDNAYRPFSHESPRYPPNSTPNEREEINNTFDNHLLTNKHRVRFWEWYIRWLQDCLRPS